MRKPIPKFPAKHSLTVGLSLLVAVLAFSGRASLFGQHGGPVAILTQQYEEAKARTLSPIKDEKEKISDAYLAQLTVMEREYAAKGALEPVLELQKERELFETSGETGGGTLDALRVMREKLQRDLAASEAKTAKAVADLEEVYRTRLEQIIVEQTKAGNIEEAKAAKAILDGGSTGLPSGPLVAPTSGTKRSPWTAPAPAHESVFDGGIFHDPITLPAGTHRLRNKISIGSRQPAPRFNDIYLVEGTKISCAEGGEIFLALGKGNAFGVVFDSAYVTAGLNGDWHFINCAFENTRLAKADGWGGKHQATTWRFENCLIQGSFFPKWNTQDVGYLVESSTFDGVKFPDLEYRADAGGLAQSDVLLMKNCRFRSCDLPLSVLITTEDCVFEQCTFRDDAAGFSITSSVKATVFATNSSNRIRNVPPQVKFEIRDLKEFHGKAGAEVE